jgi:hypothetical protein
MFYTNNCFKLRAAACYPCGKISCFHKMVAQFETRIRISITVAVYRFCATTLAVLFLFCL